MRRREFIGIFTGSICATAWRPAILRAQQPRKVARVGALWHAASEDEEAPFIGALRRGFSDIGYVEGKDFVLENRFPAERYARFVELTAELIEAKVDVLVAVTSLGARVAQQATTTVPIVFVLVPDPVGLGLVESLARPGGNVTGLSSMTTDLAGKQLGLFKEVIPGLSVVTLLANASNPLTRRFIDQYKTAATNLGLEIEQKQVTRPDELEAAISKIPARTGLVLLSDPMLNNERKPIAEIALKCGLPSIAWFPELADAGIMMSYGPDTLAQLRRAPAYVDKILKGAKPGDLPVEQPTRFELVINLRTAKALGVDVPPAFTALADKVIE